jgi:hypothetical protein
VSEVAAEIKVGRNGYLRPFKDLADFYEVSLRTAKNWAAEGKAADDRCPLDDPEELREWWARIHSGRACPAGIIKHVVSGRVDPPAPVRESERLKNQETGSAGTLARLEEIEILLAAKAQEPGGARDWLSTVSRLQLATTKFREEEEKYGRLVSREMVSQVIRDFHGPIEQSVRGLFGTMCALTGFPITPSAEEAWLKSCDKLFINFKTEIFDAS